MTTLPTEEQLNHLYMKSVQKVSLNPGWYRLSLVLYILWGYAYLIILAIVSSIIGLFTLYVSYMQPLLLFVSAFCFYFLWLIIRQIAEMLAAIRRPRYVVKISTSSPLAKLVNELCQSMKVKPVSDVYLVPESNARTTRLRGKESIFVGVPLLAVLDKEQITAVLAHEIAHIALRHGRMARFLFSASEYWNGIGISMQQGLGLAGDFGRLRKFYIRFIPRLQVKMAALDKETEFEADRLASEAVGKGEMGNTLEILHLFNLLSLSQNVWSDYYKFAKDQEEPPDAFLFLQSAVRSAEPTLLTTLHDACLKKDTEPRSTHPCLRERLQRLGCQPNNTLSFSQNSATELLSRQDRLDWEKSLALWLKYRWKQASLVQQELLAAQKSMEEEGKETPLWLLYRLLSHAEFLEIAYNQKAQNSYDAFALYVCGRDKVFRGEASGLEDLKFAFNKNYMLRNEVYYAVRLYFDHYGTPEELTDFTRQNDKMMGRARIGAVAYHQHSLSQHQLVVPVSIDHREKIDVPNSLKTMHDVPQSYWTDIEQIASDCRILHKAHILRGYGGYLMLVRYKFGWKSHKHDEMRRKFIESTIYATSNILDERILICTETQLVSRFGLKGTFNYYGRKIK